MNAPKRNAPLWVKVLVAFHLLAILVWSLPDPAVGTLSGRVPAQGNEQLLLANYKYGKFNPVIRNYLLGTGAWQYWDMFAPNPANTDVWGDMIVTRQSGAEETYAYPRMALMPIPEKYAKERYRKFFERVSTNQFAYLWEPFAARIARNVDTDPANRPVKIQLRAHRNRVADMGQPPNTEYVTEVFYTHDVTEQDLAMTGASK